MRRVCIPTQTPRSILGGLATHRTFRIRWPRVIATPRPRCRRPHPRHDVVEAYVAARHEHVGLEHEAQRLYARPVQVDDQRRPHAPARQASYATLQMSCLKDNCCYNVCSHTRPPPIERDSDILKPRGHVRIVATRQTTLPLVALQNI